MFDDFRAFDQGLRDGWTSGSAHDPAYGQHHVLQEDECAEMVVLFVKLTNNGIGPNHFNQDKKDKDIKKRKSKQDKN